MKQYVIRRILISIVVLFGVSFMIYGILRLMPGDFIEQMTSGNPSITAEQKEFLRESYGLNGTVIEGYVTWIKKAITGDFGKSFLYAKPVTEVIKSRMWTSFSLAAIAFVIQLCIAIPLGILAATKQYTKTDYLIVFLALAGISLPSFFLAAVLQRVFAMGLGWVPLSGMVTARENFTGFRLTLDIGGWLRYVRTNMLEVLNADYIRTARAKGLSERKVIGKHGFRNTLIPIVTFIGGTIPSLFAGAIISEGIFSIPGLGKAALDAVQNKDLPFLMGYLMFMAVLTLLGTLISDILYAVVDPRVRYN